MVSEARGVALRSAQRKPTRTSNADGTIYRFGRQMLVQLTLPGVDDSLAPVHHLKRNNEAGPFDLSLAFVRRVWQHATPVPKHRRDTPAPASS